MPKGNPKKSTIRNERSQKKNGWAAKTYKLKAEVADQFKEACQKNGESQMAALTRMMKQYTAGEMFNGEERK